jgi:hypothetical protein
MSSIGSKKIILSASAILMVGIGAGLFGALAFKKLPAGWLQGGKATGVDTDQPAPLFYATIGDSRPEEHGGVVAEDAQSHLSEAKFTIEIAKLGTREQAEALIKNLAQKGLDAYYTPLLKDGRVIYRVRYGVFDTEILARSMLKSIQAKHSLKATLSRM